MTVSPNLHLSWTAVPVADLLLCQTLLQTVSIGESAKPEPTTNEHWRFCLYVLYERGVSLIGPGPKALIGPVDIRDVREASKKDLLEEWEPKLQDPTPRAGLSSRPP